MIPLANGTNRPPTLAAGIGQVYIDSATIPHVDVRPKSRSAGGPIGLGLWSLFMLTSSLGTGHKVVTAGTSMGEERVEETLGVATTVDQPVHYSSRLAVSHLQDDTIRSRRSSRIDGIARQDGKFVPRGGVGEREAFIVVVLVRIRARPQRGA